MGKRLIAAIALLSAIAAAVGAQTYKAAIVQVSTSETFKSLLMAIGEEMKVTFDAQIAPGARTTFLIENKQVDVVMPSTALKAAAEIAALKYDYSTDTIYKNAYVLYTNKGKPIDIAELKKGNPKGYKIETGGANLTLFGFTALPSTSADGSMKKVDAGAIDGYLFSQTTSDAALKAAGVKNIKRQLYDYYDLVFLLQKGSRGGPLDKLISAGIAKLKANGRFDKIIGDVAKSGQYVDWQP
jgi:polar amino acid transport system substrate-binding protein